MIQKEIEKTLKDNDVVVFMKGTKELPSCGFSASVVHILKEIGVPFITINVLEDEILRQGIKNFSNWPTLPQVYLKGEFIGGCDIIRELYQNGELQLLFKDKGLLKDICKI